jgi:hypothetical protein
VPSTDAVDLSAEAGTSRQSPLSVQMVRGVVAALPGCVTTDFEDQIEEAMEEEAQRIVDGN